MSEDAETQAAADLIAGLPHRDVEDLLCAIASAKDETGAAFRLDPRQLIRFISAAIAYQKGHVT